MTSLQLFVTEPELEQIIRDFASKHNLSGCLQIAGQYEPFDPTESPSLMTLKIDLVVKVYLFPVNQIPKSFSSDTIQPKQSSWIDILPNKLIKKGDSKILTMAIIQAENRKGVTFKPANWLNKLKKDLMRQFYFGVEAVNVVYGGRGIYKDTGYSPEALLLYRSGILWKQFDTGNVVYHPLTTDGDPSQRHG